MLRFTPAESRSVLDVGLDESERDALAERIEEWPVALQLARLISLQAKPLGNEHSLSLGRLARRGGHLWTFLSDQVLNGLSQDAVDFLLDTSILERFSVEIADATRQRHDGWHIMEQLEQLQSLVAPLDGDAAWFRYHHLFAEYLQAQLRQRRPASVAALHLRASEAFERSGLLEEAVRHASLAGDYARCSALVEQAGGWRLILFGGLSQLNQLLDLIPLAERLSHPRLLIAEAYARVKMGRLREARSTFDLVATDDEAPVKDWSALDDCERDILNVDFLLRIYEDNSIDLPLLRRIRHARERLPDADGLTQGILECVGTVAALCLGDFDHAEATARQAMSAMRSANSVLGLNYCFLHAGVACTYQGELRSAAAYLERAKAMAEENFGADSGLKAVAETLLSMVELWTGGPFARTVADLDEAFRHVCDYDGWVEVYAAGLERRFRPAWLAGNIAAMDLVIADGQALAEARGLLRLATIVKAQRLQRHLIAGATKPAAALAEKLASQFPLGIWRENRVCWRPYQDVAFALVMWFARRAPLIASARAADALDCAQAVGARPYVVRAHLLLARSADLAGQSEAAMSHLKRAVGEAAGEGISLPFYEQPELAPLIRYLTRDIWDSGGNPVEASFLSEIAERTETTPASDGRAAILSTREQEVMAELARGLGSRPDGGLDDLSGRDRASRIDRHHGNGDKGRFGAGENRPRAGAGHVRRSVRIGGADLASRGCGAVGARIGRPGFQRSGVRDRGNLRRRYRHPAGLWPLRAKAAACRLGRRTCSGRGFPGDHAAGILRQCRPWRGRPCDRDDKARIWPARADRSAVRGMDRFCREPLLCEPVVRQSTSQGQIPADRVCGLGSRGRSGGVGRRIRIHSVPSGAGCVAAAACHHPHHVSLRGPRPGRPSRGGPGGVVLGRRDDRRRRDDASPRHADRPSGSGRRGDDDAGVHADAPGGPSPDMMSLLGDRPQNRRCKHAGRREPDWHFSA
ncbi:MAG TPA: hypothetical protein VF643_08475 [Sphingomonas sp.]